MENDLVYSGDECNSHDAHNLENKTVVAAVKNMIGALTQLIFALKRQERPLIYTISLSKPMLQEW